MRKIPKTDAADIEKLNALRNGVAFFPENLKKSRPVWDGKNIFSLEGLQAFQADMRQVIEFFQRIRYGRYSQSIEAGSTRQETMPYGLWLWANPSVTITAYLL